MATYVPPKVSTQFITFIGLVDQSSTLKLKSNPTIAAGDFKVSIDGGALANLGTLPTVTPASSVMVKVTLSTSEMAGANATVVSIDAAGAEWCDREDNFQTAANQIDDLATLLTAIKAKTDSLTFTTANKVDSTIQAAADLAQAAADKVWATAARVLTAGTNIVLAKGVGVTGFNDLDAAGVRAAVGLATANLDTQLAAISGAILNAAAIRAAIGLATANLDTQLAAISAAVPTAAAIRAAVGLAAANLDTQLAALDVDILSRLATAGYTAPLSAAGTRSALGMGSANLDTQLGALPTDADVQAAAAAAITASEPIDANLVKINGTTVNGDGAGTPWGP